MSVPTARYWVQWRDRENVHRKGAVEYKGRTVFDDMEEAKEAAQQDRLEELSLNPDSEMEWTIWVLEK